METWGTLNSDTLSYIFQFLGELESLETLDILSRVSKSFNARALSIRPKMYLQRLENVKRMENIGPFQFLALIFTDWESLQMAVKLHGTKLCDYAILGFTLGYFLSWRSIETFLLFGLQLDYIFYGKTVALMAGSLLCLFLADNRLLCSSAERTANSILRSGVTFLAGITLVYVLVSWDSKITQAIPSSAYAIMCLSRFYVFNYGIPFYVLTWESDMMDKTIVFGYSLSMLSFMLKLYLLMDLQLPMYINFSYLIFTCIFLSFFCPQSQRKSTYGGSLVLQTCLGLLVVYFLYFILLVLIQIFESYAIGGKAFSINYSTTSLVSTHFLMVTSFVRTLGLSANEPAFRSERLLVYSNAHPERKKFVFKKYQKLAEETENDEFGAIRESPNELQMGLRTMDNDFLFAARYAYLNIVEVTYNYCGFASVIYNHGVSVQAKLGDMKKRFNDQSLVMGALLERSFFLSSEILGHFARFREKSWTTMKILVSQYLLLCAYFVYNA